MTSKKTSMGIGQQGSWLGPNQGLSAAPHRKRSVPRIGTARHLLVALMVYTKAEEVCHYEKAEKPRGGGGGG